MNPLSSHHIITCMESPKLCIMVWLVWPRDRDVTNIMIQYTNTVVCIFFKYNDVIFRNVVYMGLNITNNSHKL